VLVGWQNTQLTPPTHTHTSYRKASFVIADSDTGIVPTMLFVPKLLQCTAPSPATKHAHKQIDRG
jgi:hypothetical protein